MYRMTKLCSVKDLITFVSLLFLNSFGQVSSRNLSV